MLEIVIRACKNLPFVQSKGDFMPTNATESVLSGTRLSMSETARACGGVAVSTVWRWTLKGVRGVRLRSVHLGGRRFVLRSDLEAFLAAVNGEADDAARLGGLLTDDARTGEGGEA